MGKPALVCTIVTCLTTLLNAQPKIITTGNNVINTSDPIGADIVVGSNADGGTRHDGSIMWWSNVSASRISNSYDVFHFSVWNNGTPNIGLSAISGGSSYFLGNVGIGTTAPSSRLSIVNEGNESQGSFLFIDNPNSSYGGNATMVGIRTTGGSGSHYNFMKLQNTDGTKFLINGAGDVAIGSGDTYGYKLAVNGTIRAKEIKVEAGPWPDYVFKPGYKLPSLEEVSFYIRQNGHLPSVPSAKDLEVNGANLGELVKLQMKKIEELTIYLIEKDKQLKAQQEQITSQQKQIKKIKSVLDKIM